MFVVFLFCFLVFKYVWFVFVWFNKEIVGGNVLDFVFFVGFRFLFFEVGCLFFEDLLQWVCDK